MAATDRPTAGPAAASAVADALADAELVHLVATADGDALAAAGLLAAACETLSRPYHVNVVRTAAALDERLTVSDDSATPVVLGAPTGDASGADDVVRLASDGPVSPMAHAAADELDAAPDPTWALAGVVAAGAVPSHAATGLLEAADLDRTPGVGVPTPDLVDGLSHTGLAHAAFSGDRGAVRGALADLDLDAADADDLNESGARRRIASLLALAAGASPDAAPRAATAVERALRPHRTDGPFATLAGHADVLCALAERAPGLAVALAVGEGGREAALDVWRDQGRAAHAAVRDAGTARYRGLLVARTDVPVVAVARLLRDYRSPEPVVLAVGDGEAAAASLDAPLAEPLAAAAEAAGGSSLARGTAGRATFDPDRQERFVEAFREAR